MRFYVNDNCIGCTLCASICPEVYSMNDEGVAKAIDSDADASVKDTAKEAQSRCPVSAIEEVTSA